MVVEYTGETVDFTPSWAFAATVDAMNLLDGKDYATRRESHDRVIQTGRTLDAVLKFVDYKGETSELKEFLKGYRAGRAR